jgi:lipoprotein signal peptidase
MLLSVYIREEYPKNSRLLDTAYVAIFSGALSHAYERIFIGHVVDFIAVKYFAILNLADILISS